MKISDAASIERVLINILDNAIYALGEKYQKRQGSFAPTLNVDLIRVTPNSCQFRVRDNGIGISKENLNHIFVEFYTTKPPGQGTGIGLWIAKQIIEKNKGELNIKSEENQYTEVYVNLPGESRLPM